MATDISKENKTRSSSHSSHSSHSEKPIIQPAASLCDIIKDIAPINWNNLPYVPSIDEVLKHMFDKRISPNVTVIVQGHRYMCYDVILRLIAPFFRDSGNVDVIKLPENITTKAFEFIHDWGTNKTVALDRAILVELYIAVTFLKIPELMHMCWSAFDHEANIECNAVMLYEEARLKHVHLKDNLFQRIKRFFLTFVASKEYLEMNESDVYYLLKRHTIGVNSEMEVFMAAILWLSHKWTERRPYVKYIMECVYFDQLPFLFLLTFRKRSDCPAIELLSNDTEIEEKIRLGMSKNCSSMRECRTNSSNLKCDRFWIYDVKCPYHHCDRCDAVLYMTYEQFIDYLNSLYTLGLNHWTTLKLSSDESIHCCSKCIASDSAEE